ncbi:hypothetical protein M9R32_07695 [Paenisporosarcina quisquiliarum]|uniref:Uncharacterized protein n=1 Tax=Paenisporosarcina quisquiliarum TaxID=365346 RepID=A0A9X3LFZ2_9BACL|nr:hypothetical protein [Paenisporosarcina quisquiliarum]MCZ8537057.1 hypothetical protein [Paenisporosarcina quisquiliarum]
MGSDNHKGAINFTSPLSQTPKKKDFNATSPREEISMELVEQGFLLKPKHEPMTSNHRKKSEREKSYKS